MEDTNKNKNALDAGFSKMLKLSDDYLDKYGPQDPSGIGWTNYEGISGRLDTFMHATMPFLNKKISLLDIGCGTGALIRHIQKRNYDTHITYTGVDLSPKIANSCKENFPTYDIECRDILANPFASESFDFVFLCGIIFVKGEYTQEQKITQSLYFLKQCFKMAKLGLVFNCYSQFVDDKDDIQFYLGTDEVISAIRTHFSRYFTVLASYKAHDVTYAIYKDDIAKLLESF